MQKHCIARSWVLIAAAISLIVCEANANENINNNSSVAVSRKKESNSVKKALPANVDLSELPQPSPVPQSHVSETDSKEQMQQKQAPAVVVISEKPAPQSTQTQNTQAPKVPIEESEPSGHDDDVQIVRTHLMEPDAYRASFYFFFGISSAALLFIVVRVYRLRLSRAERKYGVQGDRANQELTPLPMAIEDINSDEDDHTLFDINRHNIRIL